MSKKTKIVYIGAGSGIFGTRMFRELFTSHELKGSTLTLVDINKDNLALMYDLAVKMNELSGAGLKIEHTTERKETLPDTEFVVNSLSIERCELWRQDFLIPKKYGIRHTLGENGGPGALSFTMRTLPFIMDIIRDMERLCPNAYFLNFSNPESRIILAVGNYTKIKAVGLCHGIFMARDIVARIMGVGPGSIDVWAAGLNHFQWLLKIRNKSSGEDMYPLLKNKNETYDPSFEPLSRKLFKVFGLYPSCSDNHIGEYLSYGWEAGEEGYDFQFDSEYRKKLKEQIKKRASGKLPMGNWITPSCIEKIEYHPNYNREKLLEYRVNQPPPERVVEIITSILYNKKKIIDSGVVINNGAITNLPEDTAVEVPLMVDAGGIHPITVGSLPMNIASLCNIQIGVQQAAVQAALTGSKKLALQALLIDPIVNSIKAAEKILEELWEINKPYIKQHPLLKKTFNEVDVLNMK